MDGNAINIHMLGEFSIDNEEHHFPQETKKSMQVILLIAYLIAHRYDVNTKAKLIEVLWPDDSSDHPEGALRNLIYRARKELAHFSDEEFILSKGNVYAWNNEIECKIDIIELEELSEEIKHAQDISRVYTLCQDLQQNFCNEFMNEFATAHWVRNQKSHYETLFLRTMDVGCSKLMDVEEYEKVILLCDFIDYKQMMDSHLHEYKLYAYYKRNQITLAISYYHKIKDMYYSRLGMEMTERMKEIYTVLLKCTSANPINVHALEQDLNEDILDQGTFYCDFDVFKNVYQINARAARRSTKSRFLVLLTLEDESGMLSDEKLQGESLLLKDIIYNSLRKNDVFSKCNPMQYTVIIAAATTEGCQKAIDRIENRYNMKKRCNCTSIHFEVKNII